MTREKILERHVATISNASEYDHTSIVCNVADTWSLIEDLIEDYWKLSFKKQCEATRKDT